MDKAAIEIPEDYSQGIQEMVGTETGPLSCFVLESMLTNWTVANEDRRPRPSVWMATRQRRPPRSPR